VKKCVFVLLSCFLSVSFAGDLSTKLDFARGIFSLYDAKETPCPKNYQESNEFGYICSTFTEKDIAQAKEFWDKNAPTLAQSLGYEYVVTRNWSTGTLIFRLDIQNFIVGFSGDGSKATGIVIVSDGGFTSPRQIPIRNTTTQSGSTAIQVLRYLCQPSERDRARVIGTIRNTSVRTLEYVKINAEFFSGSRFVGQDSTYVNATKLAPSAETTFEMLAKTPAYTRCEISFEDSSGKLPSRLP
jgi:hypothetical protein